MKDPPAMIVHRFDEVEQRLTHAPSRPVLFREPEFQDLLKGRLDSSILQANTILSVDIFDTLLLRDNSAEVTRFNEIGGLMADTANRHVSRAASGREPIRQIDAFLARHLGVQASYRASAPVDGCREGSLTDIHRTAVRLLKLRPDLAQEFIAAELRYEAARLQPNAFLLDQVRAHRARGGRAILMTDMYMHGAQIDVLFAALRVERSLFQTVLSSADKTVSKASGGLFAIAERELGATPGDFLHLGDSLSGDFQRPIERGWRALHLPLADADVVARRKDHQVTMSMLKERHGICVDIAEPG